MTRAKGRNRVMVTNPNERVGEIQRAVADSEDEQGIVETPFFNAQDGLKGRDGGPYLDYEERFAAEKVRAEREGRDEPEYGENVPASTGTVLSVAATVVDNSLTSNPSMASLPGVDPSSNDNSHLADPVSVLPVDHSFSPIVETEYVEDEEDEDEV